MKFWYPLVMIGCMMPLWTVSWQRYSKLTKEERRADSVATLAVVCSGGAILINLLAFAIGAIEYFVFGK